MIVSVTQAGPENAAALTAAHAQASPGRTPPPFDFVATRYLLARLGHRPLGFLSVTRSVRAGDPDGKHWAYLTLAPLEEVAEAEEPVLTALYQKAEAHPEVRVLYTMTHETLTRRQHVLTTLGYEEVLRSYGADLAVKDTQLTRFGDPEAKLRAEGIVIRTLGELAASDPDYRAKLYRLYLESNRDVPEVGHADTMSAVAFGAHLARPDALPEAFHVALLETGSYIGYSEIFGGDSATLQQETTAVLRAYRRRGVALALKLRGLAYAKAHGYTRVNTGLASNNVPMVALNTALGFVPQRAFVTFRKTTFNP